MAEMSPLRRRMIEDMTVRNLSPATQRSYLNAISKFRRYFGRSPDHLGLEDVHAFQVHLVATGISWPALNQIVCALRFFYGVTLGHGTIPERIAYAREPRKLPVVLSADEVVSFLEAIPSLKSRTALTTVYAAGLRVSEVAELRYCVEIRSLRRRRQIADRHVLDHAAAERADLSHRKTSCLRGGVAKNPRSSQTGGNYCDRPLTAAPAASFNPKRVRTTAGWY